jgi:hypothetical protein
MDRRFKLLAPVVVGLVSLVVIFFVGLFALLGPETKDAYTQTRTPHAALISPFESYISSADARKRLPGQVPVRLLWESKTASDDPRPRFDTVMLRVSGFEHLGFVGDLDLEFVNDRLASTEFCPTEPDSYRSALRASGVHLENDDENANAPHPGVLTLIWATYADPKDPKERSCVDWVDARLLREKGTYALKYEL